MTWHVLVDVRAGAQLRAAELQEAVEAHLLVVSASVHAPAPPPPGWRKALAAFGVSRPPSVLVSVEAAEKDDAQRIAVAAVEEALARTGVEGSARSAGAFRR